MEIRKIPIEELAPALYNPRLELQPGNPAYEKLKRSIETFGYVEPIIFNEQTGRVVGGHQRLNVLRDLGETMADCVVVDLCEADEKALNVALNKISGEWDMPKLKDLLEDIDNGAYDITLTGFDMDEIEKLMTQFAPDSEDIDSAKDSTLSGIFLSIDKVKVPITEEERTALLERLDNYVEGNGVMFGFVGDLLGD